jgi:two-component system sensor histidine kinase KdpD
VAAVAAALGISRMLQALARVENVDLIFLTAVVGIAVRYGLWPSLFASVAASLAYNFFFLPPVYTFTITEPTNVAAFLMFALLSVVVSNLAARGQTRRWRRTIACVRWNRCTGSAASCRAPARSTTCCGRPAHQIASMLKVRVVLLLPENGSIALKAGYPPEDTLDEPDLAAAKWAWEKNRPAGPDSDALPGAKWLFQPMRTGRGRSVSSASAATSRGRCCASTSAAAGCADRPERALHRTGAPRRGRRQGEADRRDGPPALGLLTSISHDLKTPLARCWVRPGRCATSAPRSTQNAKADLIATIIDEAERLNPLHRQPARI